MSQIDLAEAGSLQTVQLSIDKKVPGGEGSQLYVMRPKGEFQPHSLPLLLMTTAATGLTGNRLGAGDQGVLEKFVEHGYVAVGYEHDGFPGDSAKASQIIPAMKRFAMAAGLVNAKHAIDYALKQFPEIDPADRHVWP